MAREGGRRRAAWQHQLPLPLMLALRYLRSTRRDAFVSLLSLLAAGGIALGVSALILVLAGLSGLQGFLRRDALSRTPQIEVTLPAAHESAAGASAQLATARDALAALPEVERVQTLLRGRGWVLVAGSAVPVEIVAFEGALPDFFPDATDREPGLYLGAVQATAWGVDVGETVEVVSSRPTLTPFGPQPRVLRLPLAGTFRTGKTEQVGDRRLALPLDRGRRLLGGATPRLELRTGDLNTALAIAPKVAEVLPAGSEVRTWRDLNRGLFFALRLEKTLMFVSVFLIVPVAASALVTMLVLLVSAKRGELGMLQAMGATGAELRRGFLALGLSLSASGIVVGLVLGVGGALVLDRFRLLAAPADVYFIEHLPFVVRVQDVGTVVAATVILTALSARWAAARAAALDPVEALSV